MNNPKTQLREYLDRLIRRFLNTKSLYLELKRISGWRTPIRDEAYNLGVYFSNLRATAYGVPFSLKWPCFSPQRNKHR